MTPAKRKKYDELKLVEETSKKIKVDDKSIKDGGTF
jgi:hypothetical protein